MHTCSSRWSAWSFASTIGRTTRSFRKACERLFVPESIMPQLRTTLSPLAQHRARIDSGVSLGEIAADAIARSNSNAGRNVYLARNAVDLTAQIKAVESGHRSALYGVPVSLKDCFDLRGFTTTCGSRFYADHNQPATQDSWLAARLRSVGAIIPGKTHMHQLAYGITGQNADFRDCLQPDDSALLTGGSSSGAAASVQEGSALAAIGTDTGGSVRVPAALCGLAGYRASIGVGDWRGAVHLAPSFDTLGLLFRDLRDGPALARAISQIESGAPIVSPKIAVVPAGFLMDCEPVVVAAYAAQQWSLRESGATLHEIDVSFWAEAMEIFAPIQAHEAAAIQREKLTALGQKDFSVFEPGIAERLACGESIAPEAIEGFRRRHELFRDAMDRILVEHEFLLLPCAPMGQLRVADDHTETRRNILRYTTPISLSGMPAVTLPHPGGAGMQLVAGRGRDAELLEYAATL
jgi:Asp-tRNA(Asn)/Glu-tRNA(Gln) amidotransferase A subunit family amidase